MSEDVMEVEDEEMKEILDKVKEESIEEIEEKLPEEAKKKLVKAKKPGRKKKEVKKDDGGEHAKIDHFFKQLNAKFPDMMVGRATDDNIHKVINYERSPFGMSALNSLLSPNGRPEDGGAPHGRFVVLWGPESSCKTTLVMDCIAHRLLNHPDEYALIIDAENSVDENWCKHFGVPMDRLIIIPGTSPLEDMATHGLRILRYARENDIKISMCLIDSLGAMAPAVELEGKKSGKTKEEVDLRTDHVATSARKINQMCRIWAPEILKGNTCTFMIAHGMTDIGGYGGDVMKGGKGVKYFAHVILRMHRKNDAAFEKEIVCKDGEVRKVRTGYYVVPLVEKSKISPYEGQRVALPFLIGVGFQTMMALFNTAVALGVIDKAGSWFKYNDETIGQGQSKAMEWLNEHPEERIRIEQAISEAMYEEGKLQAA